MPEVFDARRTFDCIVGLKKFDTQSVSVIPTHFVTFKISNLTDATVFGEISTVQVFSF